MTSHIAIVLSAGLAYLLLGASSVHRYLVLFPRERILMSDKPEHSVAFRSFKESKIVPFIF